MLESLIGAGASILGGLLGSNSAEQQTKEMIDLQREFAQSGIQWRVADAKKAGIHPLYALGANTTSFSPFSVGDGGLGSSIASAGQDIGRALEGAMSKSGSAMVRKIATKQALERGQLENDLLRSQIRKNDQPGSPPRVGNPIPRPKPGSGSDRTDLSLEAAIAGQNDSKLVDKTPNQVSTSQPGDSSTEAGVNPGIRWISIPNGGLTAVPSAALKQSIEDSPDEYFDLFRRWVSQATGELKPPFTPAKGKFWQFDAVTNAWYQREFPKEFKPGTAEYPKPSDLPKAVFEWSNPSKSRHKKGNWNYDR